MIKRLLGWVWPKTDPSTLYVIIDEQPNPRDWGTVDFIAGDLPPTSRTKLRLVKSVKLEQDGHEKEQIYRRTDHWLS